MVLQEIPTRISPNTTPNAVIHAVVNDNDSNLNVHCMMHLTMGATAVNSPLPSSNIDFNYQLELAAITTAFERMKQQWMTVQPQLVELHLPLAVPTMPTPSSELDLLDAQHCLEDFLIKYP